MFEDLRELLKGAATIAAMQMKRDKDYLDRTEAENAKIREDQERYDAHSAERDAIVDAQTERAAAASERIASALERIATQLEAHSVTPSR